MTKSGNRAILGCILALLTAAASVQAFTISGTVQDPSLVLFINLMDEGAAPRGFDRISCRMIRIRAFDEQGAVAEANPDPRGAFKLVASRPVSTLAVESSAGGVYFALDGAWHSDTTVDIVIDSTRLFTLRGVVRNDDGSVARHEKVAALDAKENVLAYCYTRKSGKYVMWSNRPIEFLATTVSRKSLRIQGPWSTSATVPLHSPASLESNAP